MNIMTKLIQQVALDAEAEARRVSGEIADEVVSISEEEFFETTLNYIKENESSFEAIVFEINKFLQKLEDYNNSNFSVADQSLSGKIRSLSHKKDIIYKDFFVIQNMINNFLGQEIIMTYVHIDDEGKREIRISENDIEHLQVAGVIRYKGAKTGSVKLSYNVENHYEILKNSLPEEENVRLQIAAQTVEGRWHKYRKKVL